VPEIKKSRNVTILSTSNAKCKRKKSSKNYLLENYGKISAFIKDTKNGSNMSLSFLYYHK